MEGVFWGEKNKTWSMIGLSSYVSIYTQYAHGMTLSFHWPIKCHLCISHNGYIVQNIWSLQTSLAPFCSLVSLLIWLRSMLPNFGRALVFFFQKILLPIC